MKWLDLTCRTPELFREPRLPALHVILPKGIVAELLPESGHGLREEGSVHCATAVKMGPAPLRPSGAILTQQSLLVQFVMYPALSQSVRDPFSGFVLFFCCLQFWVQWFNLASLTHICSWNSRRQSEQETPGCLFLWLYVRKRRKRQHRNQQRPESTTTFGKWFPRVSKFNNKQQQEQQQADAI